MNVQGFHCNFCMRPINLNHHDIASVIMCSCGARYWPMKTQTDGEDNARNT